MTHLLETSDLTVAYGGLRANSDVNIRVERGRLTGLIGPNGAGKTTFIDAITGYTPITSGTAKFKGRDLVTESPAKRARSASS